MDLVPDVVMVMILSFSHLPPSHSRVCRHWRALISTRRDTWPPIVLLRVIPDASCRALSALPSWVYRLRLDYGHLQTWRPTPDYKLEPNATSARFALGMAAETTSSLPCIPTIHEWYRRGRTIRIEVVNLIESALLDNILPCRLALTIEMPQFTDHKYTFRVDHNTESKWCSTAARGVERQRCVATLQDVFHQPSLCLINVYSLAVRGLLLSPRGPAIKHLSVRCDYPEDRSACRVSSPIVKLALCPNLESLSLHGHVATLAGSKPLLYLHTATIELSREWAANTSAILELLKQSPNLRTLTVAYVGRGTRRIRWKPNAFPQIETLIVKIPSLFVLGWLTSCAPWSGVKHLEFPLSDLCSSPPPTEWFPSLHTYHLVCCKKSKCAEATRLASDTHKRIRVTHDHTHPSD